MITKHIRPVAGVSLNEASEFLTKHLGEKAPARITLHRHSAAGLLDKMVVRRSNARKYYSAEALLAHYRGFESSVPKSAPRYGPSQERGEAAQAAPSQNQVPAPVPRPLVRTEEVASTLMQHLTPLIEKQVALALAPIAETLRRVDRGLNDLASTRTSLMLKYDAEATTNLQRLEEAKAEIRRLKGSTDTDQQLHRIRLDLSRLMDAVGRLQNHQE